jgi:hypothetical protein
MPKSPTPVAAATSPVVAPYSNRAKRAGELVELRVATGNWVAVTKPKSRRGRHYRAHVRAVRELFLEKGIPQTSANWRRMGFGRAAKLKQVLAELAVEDAAAGEESVVDAAAPPTIAAAVKVVIEM